MNISKEELFVLNPHEKLVGATLIISCGVRSYYWLPPRAVECISIDEKLEKQSMSVDKKLDEQSLSVDQKLGGGGQLCLLMKLEEQSMCVDEKLLEEQYLSVDEKLEE